VLRYKKKLTTLNIENKEQHMQILTEAQRWLESNKQSEAQFINAKLSEVENYFQLLKL